MLVQENNALDKARNIADRAGAKNAPPSAMFEKGLRAFVIGDLSFSDLQSSLTRLLNDGAAPDELLRVLRRRESIEPLEEEARDKIVALLYEAMPSGTVEDTGAADRLAEARHFSEAIQPSAADEEADTSAMSRLIEEFAAEWDADSNAHPASAAATPQAAGHDADYKAMGVALGQREDDLAALQAEHSRVLSLLEARARSAAQLQNELRELASQFEESRGALQSQQGKTREIEALLAEREAALDQANRMLSEREAGDAATRGSLAERDAAIERMSHALAARDGVIEQARALLAQRDAQISALEADAASNKARPIEAMPTKEKDAWAEKLLALQHALNERDTAIETQKQQHSKTVAALMARAKNTETELKAARGRIEALASELQAARAEAARAKPDLEQTIPLLPIPESPPPQSQLRRGVQIGEFSAPPPRPAPARALTWKPDAFARTLGIFATIAVLAIIAWVAVHHGPAAANVPKVAAAPLPVRGTVLRDCPNCPSFTVLPTGRFEQGSADSNASPSAKPLHWVAISHPIAMSTNAVTVDEYRAFVTATGRDMQGCDTYDGRWKHQPKNNWLNPGFEQTGTHPVTCVSWGDAKAYAQWLSEQTGQRYRLPSASEWEYAARAGSKAVQPWAANGSDACANANVADLSAEHRYPGWVAFACSDGYVFTAPVGSFKASAFGLHDMLGNVFQWTEDCWNANYADAPIDGSARADGNCSEHELRGGSWFSSPGYVRADYRNHFAANYRASSAGIRLVRDIAP